MTQADAIRNLARYTLANPAVVVGADTREKLHEIGTAVFEDEGPGATDEAVAKEALCERIHSWRESIRKVVAYVEDDSPGTASDIERVANEMADYLMGVRRG